MVTLRCIGSIKGNIKNVLFAHRTNSFLYLVASAVDRLQRPTTQRRHKIGYGRRNNETKTKNGLQLVTHIEDKEKESFFPETWAIYMKRQLSLRIRVTLPRKETTIGGKISFDKF
ncbi:hypothetical protein TNCV_2542211 [Trichonephila clavipes]|nr:hypothetical protein TNCV_2542211 [Trichonephila clavipes]